MKRITLLHLVFLGLAACGDKEQDDTADPTTSGGTGILSTPMLTDTAPTPTTTDPTMAEGSGSTTNDASGSGTGGTTFDPNDCGEAQIEIPIVTPNVMLVLDKSGSMVTMGSGYWDHDNDDANDDGIKDSDPNMMEAATAKITRWQSLHEVVEFIVGSFDNSMNLGMVLFPSTTAQSDYSALACPVSDTPEVPVGPMTGQAILDAIPAATDTTIKGGTPATKGVKTALAELASITDEQPEFLILITDGAANCSEDAMDNAGLFEVYDSNLPAVVGEAFMTDGIPTYVVGIAISDVTTGMTKDGNPDNTNTNEKLNEVAVAGGVPRAGETKFYDTQNQLELQAALEEISMQILSCTIKLDPVPVYPNNVEVSVGTTMYGKMQVTDCENEDGWMFTTEAKDEIILCGKACADFQMTGSLDAQYRCPQSG